MLCWPLKIPILSISPLNCTLSKIPIFFVILFACKQLHFIELKSAQSLTYILTIFLIPNQCLMLAWYHFIVLCYFGNYTSFLYKEKIFPIFFTAYGNLANILIEQNKLEEAERAYRTALKYRYNMADTHYNL